MIEDHKYGYFVVDGKTHSGSMKMIDGKIRFWDPDEYEITKKDVAPLVLEKPDYILIGLGPGGLFKVMDDAQQHLYLSKVKFFMGKNVEMIKKFNEFTGMKKKVCALFPCRG